MDEWEKFKTTCRPFIKENKIIRAKKQEIFIEKLPQITNKYSEGTDFVLEKNKSLGIDANTDRKLRSGNLKIDARLDLHGFTLQQAYNRVYNFIENAIARENRVLLIITGKGLNSPTDDTIKNNIPKWFSESFFSNNIVKYCDAMPKDGGSGAIYVYLKR
ncbi:MAG: hypothetical protein Ta2D_13020 [Rickettsiales bacterium]|nr:MAG: hypothetical protein Ta2D_13020 [Rickettsiales bacterium]